MYHAAAVRILGFGEDHDAMAHSGDNLAAGFLGLGKVVKHQPVEDGRVDGLSNALLVAAGQENEVVGIEGEVGGGPGEGMAHLVALLHLSVRGDDLLVRTLTSMLLTMACIIIGSTRPKPKPYQIG